MKPRSQILSAIGLVPIALITLPEHWPTFAKVAIWYLALHALHALIWCGTKYIEWHTSRMFARFEERDRQRLRDRMRVEKLQVTPDEWNRMMTVLPPDESNDIRKLSRRGAMKN